MTREILFKAKCKDWQELPKEKWWVEGYPVKYPSEKVEMHEKCIEPPDILKITEIAPETLCQYTGLTDKNGKRIWENDVVRTSKFGKDDGDGHNYAGLDMFVVKWDSGGFALFNKWRRFNLREDEKSYEVLDNIFDNPELLQEV